MVIDYAASVINQYTAGYPSWLVVSVSVGVVLLSWLLADMGIFSKSKFVVKDKVRLDVASLPVACLTGRLR